MFIASSLILFYRILGERVLMLFLLATCLGRVQPEIDFPLAFGIIRFLS